MSAWLLRRMLAGKPMPVWLSLWPDTGSCAAGGLWKNDQSG
ncbi:hypothetical protein [Pseudomonas putida]|nr:hypothetical protein [Pseudomonas putida]